MKLLIIRPAALGDTLMLMPSIAHLRPQAEITLVGRYPGLLFLRPYVHSLIDYEGPGWHGLFLETTDGLPNLGIPPADRVVAFLSNPPETVIRNLKICLPYAPIHVFAGFPPKEAKVHVAFYLAHCLEGAGIPIDPESCFKEALRSPLLGGRRPPSQETTILLHPGSGGRNKNHSVQFWLELIRELKEKTPPPSPSIRLGLLLGPAEELLYPVFRERLEDESVKITFLPRTEDLKLLLEKTALYIGHDSGVTHLAAMLGTPTIALFKNTSVHQWRPLGPRVTVICKEEGDQDLLGCILDEIYARIGTWIDQEECRILLSNKPYGPNNRDN